MHPYAKTFFKNHAVCLSKLDCTVPIKIIDFSHLFRWDNHWPPNTFMPHCIRNMKSDIMPQSKKKIVIDIYLL